MINPKRSIVTLIFSFCIWLICPTASYAEWIIVTHANYPPYNFLNNAGEPAGLDTELVQAVMKYLNIDYTIKFVPWKRVMLLTENNQVDLSFQYKSKEERRQKYLLVGPLRSGKTVFVVRQDSEISDYGTLEDFKPYTIGHNLGYSYGKKFDNASYLKKNGGAVTDRQLIK